MDIIDNFRARRGAGRLTDEALHARALREVKSGIFREGLWAMALAQAQMRTQAMYLKLLVQALRDELDHGRATENDGGARQSQGEGAARAEQRTLENGASEAERNVPVSGRRDWLDVLLGSFAVFVFVATLVAIILAFK